MKHIEHQVELIQPAKVTVAVRRNRYNFTHRLTLSVYAYIVGLALDHDGEADVHDMEVTMADRWNLSHKERTLLCCDAGGKKNDTRTVVERECSLIKDILINAGQVDHWTVSGRGRVRLKDGKYIKLILDYSPYRPKRRPHEKVEPQQPSQW
jgi:hypothetical protein